VTKIPADESWENKRWDASGTWLGKVYQDKLAKRGGGEIIDKKKNGGK